GIHSAVEEALHHRPPAKKADDEPWTAADIPLLDEAEALIGGVRATYGHVVADEAQDLSAMALRMLARRSPSGSLTVLGDLAQSTAPGGQETWDAVVEDLGSPPSTHLAELDVGYRVPGPILDAASLLLPVAAPNVAPTRSIRTAGEAPWATRTAPGPGLLAEVVARARLLAGEWTSTAVVAPRSLTDEVLAALVAAGVDAG